MKLRFHHSFDPPAGELCSLNNIRVGVRAGQTISQHPWASSHLQCQKVAQLWLKMPGYLPQAKMYFQEGENRIHFLWKMVLCRKPTHLCDVQNWRPEFNYGDGRIISYYLLSFFSAPFLPFFPFSIFLFYKTRFDFVVGCFIVLFWLCD